MKRLLLCELMILALLALACSPTWNIYADNMFKGKRLLREEEYAQARDDFLKAAETQKWPAAYAFAATASYKMGDLTGAERYVMEAERLDGGTFYYLRIIGYKALIFLKQGKEKEGLETLQYYAQLLRSVSSPVGARQVEALAKRQPVDLAELEKLIDGQVGQYEADIEQYLSTGTGFYDRRGTFRPVPSVPGSF